MANICLRKHQQDAILTTIENNFESGVHSHATGTGKSLIGLYILKEYVIKNNNNNIWWICEQKSVLQKFFNDEFVLKFINHVYYSFVNYEPIKTVWDEHLSGKHDWTPKIWGVLMFQAWYKEYQIKKD